MAYTFKTILIPIDFSINTEVAVKKGLELADENCVFHLLHVQSFPSPDFSEAFGFFIKGYREKQVDIIKGKILQWKNKMLEAKPGITVYTEVVTKDSVESAIEKKAMAVNADLIIICRNSQHSFFPFLNTVLPNSIASHSGIAVLTVKTGAENNQLKNIIVPIASEIDQHKMDIIASFSKKFKVKIHLVTFMNASNKPLDFNATSLLQLYQWVKTYLHCPVEYAVLHGKNKAKAILKYAKKIDADIILVHPKKETKIGWLNQQISDVIPPESKFELLAIQPMG